MTLELVAEVGHCLDQGSASFFCEVPESKYVRLCGPYNLCCNYSAVVAICNMQMNGYGFFSIDFIYKNKEWARFGPRPLFQ